MVDAVTGEQHLGARVLKRVAQLRRGVALVERDEHHPGPRHGLVELEVAVAVATDDRDAVAPSDAQLAQRSDQSPDTVPGVSVGQL